MLPLYLVLCLKAVAASLLACILYVVVNPYHRWRYRHIPGPPYRPIYGNLPEFRSIGSHEFMAACRERYGPIFKLWLGHRVWVVVAEPDAAKRVNYRLLNRPRRLGDPLMRGAVVKEENRGLFFSRDNLWRMLHKVWQPVFYADSVRACAPLMESTTQRLVTRLDAIAASHAPVDMWREVGNLTMAIVGTAAYGIDFHTMDLDGAEQPPPPPAPPGVRAVVASLRGRIAGGGSAPLLASLVNLSQADDGVAPVGRHLIASAQVLFSAAAATSGSVYQAMALLAPGVLRGAINFAAHAFPDAPFRRVMEARLTMSAASNALVQQAQAAQQEKQQQEQGQEQEQGQDAAAQAQPQPRRRGPIAPGSFLGLMLSARDKAGHALTDTQLFMQASTFTMAGYETTANTLAFSLFCLASHPEAERCVLDEIHAAALADAAAKEAGEATPWHSRDLEQQFPYTCAVVSEALRLYPPGASTFREVGDAPMDVGGFNMPPGTTLVVASYVIQRDPRTWPRAAEFLPQRWLPGNEHLAASNPASYLPFGSGPRMCIGYRFALQEVRLGVIQLLQRFHFDIDWSLMMPRGQPSKAADGADDACERLRTTNNFTLSPAGGIWTRVRPRAQPAGVPLL